MTKPRDDILVNALNNLLTKLFPGLGINPDTSYKILEHFLFSIIPGYIFTWYLWRAGHRYNDVILQSIAVIFFLVDNYMMYRRFNDLSEGDEYFSKMLSQWLNLTTNKLSFGLLYMLIPALIFGPYMVWKGVTVQDMPLAMIGLGIILVDLYHFYKH